MDNQYILNHIVSYLELEDKDLLYTSKPFNTAFKLNKKRHYKTLIQHITKTTSNKNALNKIVTMRNLDPELIYKELSNIYTCESIWEAAITEGNLAILYISDLNIDNRSGNTSLEERIARSKHRSIDVYMYFHDQVSTEKIFKHSLSVSNHELVIYLIRELDD